MKKSNKNNCISNKKERKKFIGGIKGVRYRKVNYVESLLKIRIAEQIAIYITKIKRADYLKVDDILRPLFDIVTILRNINIEKDVIVKTKEIDDIYNVFSKYGLGKNELSLLINNLKNFPYLFNTISEEEFLNIFKGVYQNIEYNNGKIYPIHILSNEQTHKYRRQSNPLEIISLERNK